MSTSMKIDFVSDVSCPWCVVGLRSLEQAIERVGDNIDVDLHFQPFELNPQMPAGGQDIFEHVAQKYGSTREQFAANGEAISARGAALGFTFRMDKRGRIYNTFDAHRLLHWAELQGKQLALKNALFDAYFTEGLNPEDHAVLTELAASVGLDATQAQQILASDTYAAEVRAQEQFYRGQGINAVPAVIINDRHLISGGQPVEVFEQALRQLAAADAQ
ncbi:MAG: oxidoreductase [Herbaspirillum sp.]|jgi:predicted DsbA family dithiol-disulfide isomerase|nr:oxidoreductase [Herbaspirillum sp.]